MDEREQPYTVVVGVSATSGSPTALVWAHAQAEANGGRVIAVRVYQPPNLPAAPAGTSLSHPAGSGAAARRPAGPAGARRRRGAGREPRGGAAGDPRRQATRAAGAGPRGGPSRDRCAADTVDVAAASPPDRVRRLLPSRGHAPVDLGRSCVRTVPRRARGRASCPAVSRHERSARLPTSGRPDQLTGATELRGPLGSSSARWETAVASTVWDVTAIRACARRD